MLKVTVLSADAALLEGLTTSAAALPTVTGFSVLTDLNAGFARLCAAMPDIMLLDLALPGADPLSVLEFFENADFEKSPLLFALTNYVTPQFLRFTKGIVTYFFVRPIAPAVLLSHISQITALQSGATPAPSVNARKTERVAAKLLQNLGVSPHLQGYRFLLEAVKMVCAADNLTKLRVMGDIYPAVAEKCGCSVAVVERGMRHAIASSWIFADIGCLQAHFGYTVDAARDVPSNSAYIFTVAAHVRAKMREQS
ncbi:MAG: hypothetical protein FWF10_01525 [Clostridiales bacterium]|nr:hypothetical protein [Clostridiales bacterium]